MRFNPPLEKSPPHQHLQAPRRAIFLAGKILGRGRTVRRRIRELEQRVHESLGAPTMMERLAAWAALGLAVWTGVTLKFDLFQHPKLIRQTFRMPSDAPRRQQRSVEQIVH